MQQVDTSGNGSSIGDQWVAFTGSNGGWSDFRYLSQQLQENPGLSSYTWHFNNTDIGSMWHLVFVTHSQDTWKLSCETRAHKTKECTRGRWAEGGPYLGSLRIFETQHSKNYMG